MTDYVHPDLAELTELLLRAADRDQNLNGLVSVALARAADQRGDLDHLLGFWEGAAGSKHLHDLVDHARVYKSDGSGVHRDQVQAGVQRQRGQWVTVEDLVAQLGMTEPEVRLQLEDLQRLGWIRRSQRLPERYRGWPAEDD